MADRQATSIPWTSLAVVVAFVSSTLLVPRAFEQLRPGERERAQSPPEAELEIDARLWEDPFAATRRAEAERLLDCEKQKGKATLSPDCQPAALAARRMPESLLARWADEPEVRLERTLVITVLVPGNPFVGAEESRRRTRYAVLAGLQAQRFVPDNAERIGLLQMALPTRRDLLVPYDLLSAQARPGSERAATPEAYDRVAVLWVDETALPSPKFDATARLLAAVLKTPATPGAGSGVPDLAVIGPSSSDALRIALADLDRFAARCLAPGKGCADDPQAVAGYRHLARARLFNASATAPLWALLPQAASAPMAAAAPAAAAASAGAAKVDLDDAQVLDRFLRERIESIAPAAHASDLRYRRTIATDSAVLGLLVQELSLRFPSPLHRRVVLVAERDSVYAQAMVDGFRQRLAALPAAGGLSLESMFFFRGLDGITARDGGREGIDAKAAAGKGGSPPVAIEWPESRDQLDYLRRMALALKASETGPQSVPIGAIGIVANDVHDKLLVLQALHDSFPDKMFFTSDMDARFLHPRTMPFTRNLIVATSLPLAFPVPSVQAGTPPLRDVYQSSAYLAAQLAVCRGAACASLDAVVTQAVELPTLYEIGRNRAVPLAGWDLLASTTVSNGGRAALALALLAGLAALLLAWPSTPVLRLATGRLPSRAVQPAWTLVLLVSLHAGVLGLALASAIEFVEPQRLGQGGVVACVVVAVAAAAVLGLAGLRRGHVAFLVFEPRIAWWRRAASAAAVAAAGALALLLWPTARESPCDVCEPVAWLEGISAWPTHLIHLLALAAIVMALDHAWSRALRSLSDDESWLGLARAATAAAPAAAVPAPAAPPQRQPLQRRLRALNTKLRRGSIALWPVDHRRGVDITGLWRQYAQRGLPGVRVWRILWWYAVTVVTIAVLYVAFSEGYVPEVPVRGPVQRELIAATLYAVLLLLPLLVVAVADATLLVCHLIWRLNRTRSAYPPLTVARFAEALGDEHSAAWKTPIAADPMQRGHAGAPAQHSLLDGWIDLQLVVRRTEAVGPLIIGPLVVVALLVVARSRLFDNWAFTLPIALAAGGYLVWLMVLSVLLKRAAEKTREHTLEQLGADLRWLAGEGSELAKLVEPMKRLIAAVGDERRGAFANLLDQPLFKGLMVPLGGAGGAQLFDYFLLAR